VSALTDPRGAVEDLTRPEGWVLGVSAAFLLFLLAALLTGALGPTYFLFLVGLAGMYALLSFGLNSQWGFAGLINFSVAAFFGVGAYGAALFTASGSPLVELFEGVPLLPSLLGLPIVGLVVGLAVAFVLAILIGIPTLRLRADYLAIASLGLAEVVRLIVLNERWLTNGSAGVRGIPGFFAGWPVLGTFPEAMPGLRLEVIPGSPVLLETAFWQALLNVLLVLAFAGGVYFVLRRAHRSPWGRVLRTIRSDEDLARALGKDTYSFKMQSFVLGSLIMALAGVFYTHLNLYVGPDHDVLRVGRRDPRRQRLEPRGAVRRHRHRHDPGGDAVPQRRGAADRPRAAPTAADRGRDNRRDALPAAGGAPPAARADLAERGRRRRRAGLTG